MKKYILFLLTILTSSLGSQLFAQNMTFDDGTVWNCDQNFAPVAVRYWKLYSFNDTWNNNTNTNTYLNEYFVQYKNASYLSQGQAYGNGRLFDWTQTLRNASYTVAPNSSMQILSTRYEDWGIVQKPATRSNPAIGQYDFMIAYRVQYDKSNNYPDASDDISHVECQPYYVTWCGDGIKDATYEQCDGTDGITAGQTCNSSCQIVNNPAPTCTNLTSSVLIGNAPVSTNVACTSQNATTVAIECGNGQNINSASGTCTYTTPGYYSAVCKVDGNITNANCQKNIQVDPPILAACVPGTTTGPQVAPLTAASPNLCPAAQVVGGFTGTTIGTLTTYNWSCNGSAVGGACAASYNSAANTPILSIKKYANTNDGQVVGDALSLVAGSSFNYRYDITNSGNVAATGVVVTDTLPQYTTLGTITAPAGWTCSTGSKMVATITYPTIICTTPSLAPNTTVSVTVGATLAAVIPLNTELRNIVYVCKAGDVPNTNCTPGCTDPNNPTCTPPPPPPNCNPIAGSPNYDPACVIVVNAAFDLSIKKYVNGSDAQANVNAVDIASNTGFTYTLEVRNEGPVTSTGTTTVSDTLPAGVTLVSVPNITPWTCTANIPGNSFNCATSNQIASGATFPIITVNATTTSNTGYINNIGTVANANDTNPLNNSDPAVIRAGVTAVNGFDLSLKKYIGVNDAQTAPGVSTTNNAVLSYILRVTNSGTMASSGTTTVQDIIPSGVEYDTAATGSGWTCSVSGRTLTCTSTQIVASGSSYPDITVPFRVTATAGQTVTNIAAVNNPNEINQCNASGLLPSTDTATCTGDATNSDPAVLSIPGGSSGGASNVGKKCVNGVATCATYNSIIACEAEIGAGKCYAADAAGLALCQNQSLSCSGPGGPSGCTGPGCYTTGYCGDGVLQNGEECDVQGLNGTVGAFCSVSCKITNLTNPGANPITDLWMTIPVLAGTQRLGYTWLDGTPGKVAFSDNRMVLGVGTKAFTLADTVGFGIKTQYRVPIMIEADKKTCLQSTGNSLNSETICTSFGDASTLSSNVHVFTRYDGKKYVVIGNGDYQYQTGPLSAFYVNSLQSNSNSINLFKGPVQYQMPNGNAGPTLNSAFFARNIGTDGVISLLGCSGTDCSASSVVNLVSLPVRVSSAVVSSVGSSSNRSLETFLNPGNLFTGFLGSTKGYTSTTNSNSNTTLNNTVPLPIIHSSTASPTVTTVTELESYGVNGNKNVISIKGDLTIACPVGAKVFTMNGVRTIIVEGNIIFMCNVGYGSNDSSSSWAWISKGGNIRVYNGVGTLSDGAVTNLAGIFVSIREGSNGGDITYTGNTTTQTILRIEGTLYGNATPLFNSRLYARATGSYDILTTGTILNYSNRALVSPPPLLSQYLRNYQVQRVVQ